MSINLSCEIKTKYNYKRIEEIKKRLIQSLEIETILKNIQGQAIRLENGHNSKGILVEMVETSTMKVKGRVYADPSKFMTKDANGKDTCYLLFEYFGTGAYAEMEHIGKTSHFKETGYTEWYIPVNKVGRNLNFPIITIGGAQFYVATGAKGNHFLGDAEFETRNENLDITKKAIHNMLAEVCK